MTRRRQNVPEKQTTARRGFLAWLVSQQLEEASFLYEQRRFLLDTDQLPWTDVADNEARHARHLFALELLTQHPDGQLNIDALIEDAGGLHAAVSLYCSQGRFSALENVIAAANLRDAAAFAAVADGLKWTLPPSWRRRLVAFAEGRDERYVDLLAMVFGYRRWPLDAVLAMSPNRISKEIVWAIGRSGAADGIPRLKRVLSSDMDALKRDAAVALLRLGYSRHLQDIFPIVDAHHWGILALGLLGMGDVQERLVRLTAISPSEETVLALGLLGRPSAVPLLISLLSRESLGEAASTALHLITGANLYENVFVPEEIVPEALTADERERYESGAPVFDGEEMRGETVERLSQDPSEWARWWRDHRPGFAPDRPCRLGSPYAPTLLVDQLASRRGTGLLRALAYEELVIRYRIDFAFDTDMGVREQQQLLSDFRQWLGTHGDVASRYAG